MEGIAANRQKGGGECFYLFSLLRVILPSALLCLLIPSALPWDLSANVLKFNIFLEGELIFVARC